MSLHTTYKWTNATRRLRCSQHLIHKSTTPATESILAQVGMQFHGLRLSKPFNLQLCSIETLPTLYRRKYRFSFLNFRLALKSHSTLRSYTGRPATRLEITVVDTCLPALPVKGSTTTKLWQQEKHLEAQLSTFKHYIKLEPTPAHFLLLLGLSLSFKSSAATTFAH